jgi:vesicle transport protein SEC22
MISHGVGFVCISDKIYPKRLAYSFLDDISRQFAQQYTRDQIERASKAYAFIKFDTYIQKARRSYQDVRAQHNLDRLKEELVDVQHVMQTSIQDVLDRGNKLEHMSLLSSNLSSESKKFVQNARQLNIDMLYRKYGPPSIAILIVLFFLWIWYRWLK